MVQCRGARPTGSRAKGPGRVARGRLRSRVGPLPHPSGAVGSLAPGRGSGPLLRGRPGGLAVVAACPTTNHPFPSGPDTPPTYTPHPYTPHRGIPAPPPPLAEPCQGRSLIAAWLPSNANPCNPCPPGVGRGGRITDDEVARARANLDRLLRSEAQISTAVANALVDASQASPTANPSDLWQHVIYRHLLDKGWNDNKWKRVSGFALERAFVAVYEPRLAAYGLRMRTLPAREANRFLATLDADIRATKVDLFLQGKRSPAGGIMGSSR